MPVVFEAAISNDTLLYMNFRFLLLVTFLGLSSFTDSVAEITANCPKKMEASVRTFLDRNQAKVRQTIPWIIQLQGCKSYVVVQTDNPKQHSKREDWPFSERDVFVSALGEDETLLVPKLLFRTEPGRQLKQYFVVIGLSLEQLRMQPRERALEELNAAPMEIIASQSYDVISR